ncbi:MAG: asparagine synthase-related protein [Nitrosomonadaceae bacterium]
MSAIFGIWNWNRKPADIKLLNSMSQAMSWRGNDRDNTWHNKNIGLGHRMSFTTPQSRHERLPLHDTESGLVVTADARIDDRETLCKRLNIPTQEWLSITDSLLILHAWKKWGDQCVNQLIGDYAFAIWDSRQQILFCATDPFRIRPLCYYYNNDFFVFASRLNGLLPGLLAPDAINETYIASMIINDLSDYDRDSSIYTHLKFLPAGCSLKISTKNVFQRQYWDPLQIQALPKASNDSYMEQCLEVMRRAVADRLRCDGDIGLALSGGIDSNSVGYLARNHLRNDQRQLVTVSGLSNDVNKCRESRLIQHAISSMNYSNVHMEPDFVNQNLSSLLLSMSRSDNPPRIENAFLMSLYQLANDNSLKVMLDGADGDTMFGVPPVLALAHSWRKGQWLNTIRESWLWHQNTLNGESGFSQLLHLSLKKAIFFRPPMRPLSSYRQVIGTEKSFATSLLNRDLVERNDLKGKYKMIHEKSDYGLAVDMTNEHARLINRPLMSYLPLSIDMMASTAGIEVRCPYNDRRVAEFALGLPAGQKNHSGWAKWLLRRAMDDKLPGEITWHKGREHVGWEYFNVLQDNIEHQLEDQLNDPGDEIYEYFNYKKVQEARRTPGNNPLKEQLFAAFGFAIWLNNRNDK